MYKLRREGFGSILFDNKYGNSVVLNLAATEIFEKFVNQQITDNEFFEVAKKINLSFSSKPNIKLLNEASFINHSLVSPYAVYLIVTDKCNLKCSHCFVSDSILNNNKELSFNEIKLIIDDLVKNNVFKVILTGGEPFLRKDIFRIIEYISNKGMAMQINTNGILITDDVISEILKINHNIIHFTVSLEGHNSFLHDSIRGKGNFKKVLKAIKKLSDNNFKVLVNFVVRSEIIKNIDDIFEFIQKNNIRKFNFARLRPTGNTLKNMKKFYDYSLQEYLSFLTEVQEMQKKQGEKEYVDIMGNATHVDFVGRYCNAGTISCAIRPDGKISPCSFLDGFFEKEGIELDNILDKGLHWIWRNSKPIEFMRSFKNTCSSCDHYDICGKQCPLEAYARGDFFGKSLYCFNDDPNMKLSQKVNIL